MVSPGGDGRRLAGTMLALLLLLAGAGPASAQPGGMDEPLAGEKVPTEEMVN